MLKRGWRWLVGGAVLCILAGYLFIRSFYALQEGEWSVERNAVLTAYQKSILVKPLKVERFVGNKAYTVIEGEDKIGQPVIVWVSDDEVVTEMAADGVNKEVIEAKMQEEQPDAALMRITPGKVNDQLVWEAFYKIKADNDFKYFYNHYSFRDGALIDTYRLSLQ
jgi:uncharacterized protein YpmB